MERKNFLVLVKMTGKNRPAANALRDRLVQLDVTCRFAWFDHQGLGALLSVAVPAADIRDALLPASCAEEDALGDLLILEVGPDWWAREESVADAWLGSHRRNSSAADPKG